MAVGHSLPKLTSAVMQRCVDASHRYLLQPSHPEHTERGGKTTLSSAERKHPGPRAVIPIGCPFSLPPSILQTELSGTEHPSSPMVLDMGALGVFCTLQSFFFSLI